MTNLFENTPNSAEDNAEIQNYLEHLVGEGKKFKDPEALARGKFEADRTIAAREAELAEVRKELNTRISLEEFMTKQGQREPVQTPNQVSTEIVNTNESNTDIAKTVAAEVNKLQAQAQRAANAQASRQKMKEAWGDSAVARLEQVSRDMGLGKEFLQDLAERSPDAFLQVIGAKVETSKVPNITPPTTRVNSAANVSGRNTVRNEAYWDKVRESDPKFYFSAQGYNQRHSDAQALGEGYFD